MSIDSLRQEVHSKVDSLDEAQLADLLAVLSRMEQKPETYVYDESKDVAIGLISDDDPDVASNAEEILKAGFTKRSGWTQKDQ